jgi:uncharacterized protein
MSSHLLTLLYQKVAQFESRMTLATKEKLQCKKGCSQCCYVDLSVFEIEAQSILNWFIQLSSLQKKQKLTQFEIPQEDGACVFLKNEECLIYEARPLICRTQGLPLHFINEAQEVQRDICPLNDEATPHLQPHEILNLDMLNSVLSQLESQDAKGLMRQRVPLRDLILQMNLLAIEPDK